MLCVSCIYLNACFDQSFVEGMLGVMHLGLDKLGVSLDGVWGEQVMLWPRLPRIYLHLNGRVMQVNRVCVVFLNSKCGIL